MPPQTCTPGAEKQLAELITVICWGFCCGSKCRCRQGVGMARQNHDLLKSKQRLNSQVGRQDENREFRSPGLTERRELGAGKVTQGGWEAEGAGEPNKTKA
ncbi:hypothetical protein GOODEAATRI_017234 [Goodea atripinnis]|uniref:Uncharacterized protein n=1 Tax=Goodea atripinnis TaxID=208336 RepID=A0ABV0N312_9TELE